MNKTESQKKIEEFIGRIDVVKAEIRRAQEIVIKHVSLNDGVTAREAQQDAERLTQRLRSLEVELNGLKKFW